MPEIEVPTEHLHEHMEHHAHSSRQTWVMGVALTSALLAAFAAVAALMAGHHANEAMIERIKSSDQWNYYQSKGIKSAVLGLKIETLQAQHRLVTDNDRRKMQEYKEEQEKISEQAKEFEASSESHLHHHVILARAVTFFQVAIAVGAIAALTRKRAFWFVSMGFGAVGVFFFIGGLLG